MVGATKESFPRVPPKSHFHNSFTTAVASSGNQSDHTSKGKINHTCVCKKGRRQTKDACHYEVSITALLKENWVFDKTICHQELPFLRELWSIGKVNTGDKTAWELPAKVASSQEELYMAPSHCQPLSCLLHFPLHEPPQFKLHPSQSAAAGGDVSNSPQ